MGTEITLDVSEMPISYSKNHRGMDHGSLFQECNRRVASGEPIGPDRCESKAGDPSEAAFMRPLGCIVPRLELLGFDLDHVRREYEALAKSWSEETGFDLMDFHEFREFATAIPLDDLDNTFISACEDQCETRVRGRFATVDLKRIPNYRYNHRIAYSERSFFGGLLSMLHPYSILRLLAETKSNLDASVEWIYGPLVQAGWATERQFVPCARRAETFLIATEGSSDVHILKHALALLRPGIADFFRFIDVSDSHPFSGTGSLAKFAEGLAKIDVHNQVVFVFDNDAEGLDAYQRLSSLRMPLNMRRMMLPNLNAFSAFPAQGPEGLRASDINKRAAAIECYLDLEFGGHPPAKVLWTNYKKDSGLYHGALEHKERYVRDFMRQTQETLSTGTYDTRKIASVLDMLVVECISIAASQNATRLDEGEPFSS